MSNTPSFSFLRPLRTALFIVILAITTSAQAVTGFTIDGISYHVNARQNTVTVTKVGTNNSGEAITDAVIPPTVVYDGQNYTVVTIGKDAMLNNKNLISVTIPNTVQAIEDGGIKYCSNLIKVKLGNGLRRIGYSAFEGDYKLVNVEMGNSLEVIGDRAFYECYRIDSLKMSPTLRYIGEWAFHSCSDLRYLDLGQSLISLGERAFYQCGIRRVVIPNSTIEIGGSAFEGCNQMDSLVIGNSVSKIEFAAFNDCYALSHIEFGNSLKEIGSIAFESTAWLDSQPDTLVMAGTVAYTYKGKMPSRYMLPEGVKGIASYCFYNHSELTHITLPQSLEVIGNCAFQKCSFDSIVIPDRVTTIQANAFMDCTYLESITVPNSVHSVGSGAMKNTKWLNNRSLSDVLYLGKVAYIFGNGKNHVTLYNDTRGIAGGCFSGSSALQSIVLPESLVTIGSSAFYRCKNLTSITIPDSVTTIGDKAFYECESLSSATIGKGVTSIGKQAFYNCNYMQSLDIDNAVSLKTIKAEAFKNCKMVRSIVIPRGVISIGTEVFSGLSGVTYFRSKIVDVQKVTTGNFVFSSLGTSNITVPIGTSAIYADTYPWSTFMYSEVAEPGDVSGDNDINGLDLNILINIMLGKASTTSYGKRADINNDGKVDGTDINILINIILDKNN